ncbi:hypothetical protein Tco_1193289 [Tanacetum coccineum]
MPKVEKYVTESLGAEVLARSSNQPQISYAAVTSLSEFELKKILIDKIKENKSMNRSNIQNNLYNILIESYSSDKDLFASYGDVVTLKRGRDDQDKDKEPSAGSNQGTKRRRSGKEESSKEATQKESKSTSSSKGSSRSQPKSSGKSAQADEHGPRVDDLEEPLHQEFNTGNDDVSPLAQASGTQSLFTEFLATPIDFSAFIMNRLKLNNLTQDVLTGPTYDLIKGTCKSVVELEYHLEEVFKATNDQLDWPNPEGIFLSKKSSLTKKKVADYGHVQWIEDKVPRSIWSPAQVVYDKHAYWGTYHWGPKCQRFYGYATNIETLKDVYSRYRIIVVTSLKIMEFFGYKHLEEITVRRQDDQLYRHRYSNPMIQPELEGSTQGYPLVSVEFLRLNTSAGNPVKEILLKLNLPDHSDEVLKLKNFKKDATLMLFKSTNQERYEHVGPEVTRSHGGKIYKMAKRDYAKLMISRCSRSHSRQAKEQAQDLKSMITTSNHKIND